MRAIERLDGKVVVVTGASAGVGRAVVRAFAARGANVALIARGIDGLQATAHEVEAAGGRALVLPLDVSNARGVESAASRIEDELGPIDIWVNNAMASVFAPFTEMTGDEIRRVTDVTYLGYAYGTQAALARMLPRDRGTIVQVGSALASRSLPLQSAYCAAKHAVHGLCSSIRTELVQRKSHVRLVEVQLPAVNTPQFGWSRTKLPYAPEPVPPIIQPEAAADTIVYAALHDRSELRLGWPALTALLSDKLAAWRFEEREADRLPAGRLDNLYSPLRGDHGAHGTFDRNPRSWSLAWWVRSHLGA